MADELYKHNSIRVNMFKPDSTTDSIIKKTHLLLNAFNLGDYKAQLCDIIFEKTARRAAGIFHMFKETYNLSRKDVEEKYGLNDMRKSFACKGINLLEIIDYFESNDILLADENENIITTQDNVIIKIII